MPPSLVAEIILRMFRILLERCPGGWAPSGPPWVSYRTRASGGEACPGNMPLTLSPDEPRDHTLISTWPVRPGQLRLVISRVKGRNGNGASQRGPAQARIRGVRLRRHGHHPGLVR